jgi:FtsP/CotA-like multicopper oxidase with cupredoxin domain
MITRRTMIGAAVAAGSAAMLSNLGRLATATTLADQPGDAPEGNYTPVHTPNGMTLPFKNVEGVKVMHLVAAEIEHEFVPGLRAACWGYNGRSPGPTIETTVGQRLRIYVTNHLPAPTTVHWHGIRLPNGMDGVNGLTQAPIPPGQTFRYEFTPPDAGTFMYHPHFDEMTQQAMGLMGLLIVHPREREKNPVDRDYAIMLSEWRIEPGARRPNPLEMTDFNVFTMNSKAYPATEPLVAKLGERVRIRFGNLSAMDHHPIHLHGFQTTLVEADGGAIPDSLRVFANTVLVPVGSTRAIEFIADNPGDWPMHCHMTHHTMNQMGHNVPNMVGVKAGGLDQRVDALVPGYMTMGQAGMGDMGEMSMSVPKNSIPMLGGKGQFGLIDMGGMFILIKVRERIANYDDPGDYAFPAGSVSVAATPAELRRDGIDPSASGM